MTQKNPKFILLIALSAFFASCSLIERLEFGPTNTGLYSEEDLPSYRDNYQRISSYQFNPGYGEFHIGRGRVKMTGMYSLQDSTTAGLTQLGQIDLVIDFSDRDEPRPGTPGTVEVPIVEGQISRVTNLGGAEIPEVGIGWEGTLPITGSVSLTEPIGTRNPPQEITFEAKGNLRSISPHGGAGTQRKVNLSFSGTFLKEVALGSFLFAAAGKIDSTNGESDFYLEEVR
ncbi:MAG: hypothetical protein NPIRA06_28160 [Nitrospirales bacterium]|nr:MAG: hypothetical protein NPIRA06_28160 [Nitrospirales bacterium]